MADTRATFVTFVSQKISKIRWKHTSKHALEGSDCFATGSWDDEVNKVSLWKVNRKRKFEASADGRGAEGDAENDPILLCVAPHIGDVTGLEDIVFQLVKLSLFLQSDELCMADAVLRVDAVRAIFSQERFNDFSDVTIGKLHKMFSAQGLDNIFSVLDLLKSFPPTSVKNETSFSAMKLVKNKRRGRMKSNTLNDLMLINIQGDSISDFNPETAIKQWMFISEDHLVTASSSGTVSLYKHHTNSQTLGFTPDRWEKLHHHYSKPCPCTCLAVREDFIITGGEDGRINILNPSLKDPLRTIAKPDSCTINGVLFLNHSEFLTVNNTGQLKVYDIRSKSDDPVQMLSMTGDLTPLQCVDKHPSQSHIVATGGDDGTLGIWDLRQDKMPVSLMEAHSGTMWEIKFHQSNPEHLFTCSDDGSVWHWDATQVNTASMVTNHPMTGTGAGSGGDSLQSQTVVNPWLATDIAKNKMEITSLLYHRSLPINTLDIEEHTLICGSDGETIFTLNLPALR